MLNKSNSVFLLSFILCILSIGVVKTVCYHHEVPILLPLETIPLQINGWKGINSRIDKRTLNILGVDDYIFREYEKKGQRLFVYVGYYKSQKKGALVHSPKHCYPGAGWDIITSEIVNLEISPNKRLRINKLLIRRGLEKQVVLYWYYERGRIIANEYIAKFYLIYDTLFKRRSNGALIRISMDVDNSLSNTLTAEEAFLKAFYPFLEACLPK